jgi:hypothetical protein
MDVTGQGPAPAVSHTHENTLSCPLNRRLCGSQSQYGFIGEILLSPYPGIGIFLNRPGPRRKPGGFVTEWLSTKVSKAGYSFGFDRKQLKAAWPKKPFIQLLQPITLQTDFVRRPFSLLLRQLPQDKMFSWFSVHFHRHTHLSLKGHMKSFSIVCLQGLHCYSLARDRVEVPLLFEQ